MSSARNKLKSAPSPRKPLYYIGAWTGDWGKGADGFTYIFRYYAQAVRRVLAINRQLPNDHKIRVIAMQVGWASDQDGVREITAEPHTILCLRFNQHHDGMKGMKI